jgi:hypothetical protein
MKRNSTLLLIVSFFSRLINVIEGIWVDLENRKKAFDSYAIQRGFDPLVAQNWHSVEKKDFMANVKVSIATCFTYTRTYTHSNMHTHTHKYNTCTGASIYMLIGS